VTIKRLGVASHFVAAHGKADFASMAAPHPRSLRHLHIVAHYGSSIAGMMMVFIGT
jgi:hypothetical protein